MEDRNEVFQKLKPPCVALNQAALALQGPKGNRQDVTGRLETLNYVLSSAKSKPCALDSKLAEYVFFPISQVLKASQKIPIRALELCLQCIAILIDYGWRQDIPSQLAAQIVILCSMLGERDPKGLQFSESTDELQESAFWCLHHLFSVIATKQETKQVLTSEANFPQLGQTISVIMDGIHDNESFEVEFAATSALEALIFNVIDREMQANFLPGIASKLTRILTPQTKLRRDHRVLIGCFRVLESLLRNTLSDNDPSQASNGTGVILNEESHQKTENVIDKEWQERAAEQLKPAVKSIVRLKAHTRHDVKEAVQRFCSMLLISCRRTLANCSTMALETLISICAADDALSIRVELEILLDNDSSVAELLQTMLHDWLQSLTNVVQGSDEQAKTLKLRQISVAYDLLVKLGLDTSIIDRTLSHSLRDSVVITLTAPGVKPEAEPMSAPIQSVDLTNLRSESRVMDLSSPLVKYRGQKATIENIEQLAKLASSSRCSTDFVADLARDLRHSYGETQLANFWLLLTAAESNWRRSGSVDDLLDLEDGSHSTWNEYLEDLYSFSLSILTEPANEPRDPRLQAFALRSLALQAQVAGQDFRYELVDALYPVLHTLATPDEHLQSDSIATLNVLASACGYDSVQDLIVKNVDYLTNAVALKLNAFDVSPQAPQVLLMMVRLAGPSLLPYLEDTIDSIFAALEDYHGYPLLVELLFKVLGVMAEEGVKAPQLAITNGKVGESNFFGSASWQPISVSELRILLQDRIQQDAEEVETIKNDIEPHPKRPWKTAEEYDNETDEVHEESYEDQQMEDVEPSPPAPRTYSLLLKITELTQHFLSSASPSLRTSLLSLIRTTVPTIAKHENSFLPLVNTLWPEIVSRLDDEEPYIIATALDIVRVLCESAGDFMRSRIIQLWPRLVEIHHSATTEIIQSNAYQSPASKSSAKSSSALIPSSKALKQALSGLQDRVASNSATSSRLLWQALTSCLTTIVRFVQVTPELFDEALEMMEPLLEQEEVRSAFAVDNADALWLARIRSGYVTKPKLPVVVGDHRWRFAEIVT